MALASPLWLPFLHFVLFHLEDINFRNFTKISDRENVLPQCIFEDQFCFYQDSKLMESCFGFSVMVHDEFTRKLFNIYEQVRAEGIKQVQLQFLLCFTDLSFSGHGYILTNVLWKETSDLDSSFRFYSAKIIYSLYIVINDFVYFP